MKASDRAPLVLVSWVDAASVTDRWMKRKEAIKNGLHYSSDPILACGFLIAERKKVLVLALTYNHHNDDVGHVIAIPRMAITSIVHLRGVKGSKRPANVVKR